MQEREALVTESFNKKNALRKSLASLIWGPGFFLLSLSLVKLCQHLTVIFLTFVFSGILSFTKNWARCYSAQWMKLKVVARYSSDAWFCVIVLILFAVIEVLDLLCMHFALLRKLDNFSPSSTRSWSGVFCSVGASIFFKDRACNGIVHQDFVFDLVFRR